MNKLSVIVFVMLLAVNQMFAQAVKSSIEIEEQVEELLNRMSLDDKVGQMCELTFDVVAHEPGHDKAGDNSSRNSLAGGHLSAEAVGRVFGEFQVGSILNVPHGIAQTPQVWSEIIRTLNAVSASHCNGVPQLYGVDQIHGASYTLGATLFPQEIGQGASFNKSIPHRIGEITAYESRACLIPWVYSPVMDLARSPLWPRMWESFGEDVLLNSVMASQLTRGLQGEDPNHIGMYNVAACLKHYMAYGAAVSGKDRTPSSVTYRELMEKYFVPFKACIEAGALSVMVNSANNNGVPFHANHKLLTEWLKEGLQWDGVIVTDWADIDNIWKRDHVAATKKDAICMAVNAGIDMSMDPYDTGFCTLLKELVEEGRVPMSRIDDAVRRILRLKIRVGLLDRSTWDFPYTAKGKKELSVTGLYPEFADKRFADEAVRMAEECMVLLKNDNDILPLKRGTRIFVCGPNADSFRTMNGGWSYTWQGDKTDEVCRTIGMYDTFLGALQKKFGKDNVGYSQMVAYDNGGNWRIDHKVAEDPARMGGSTAAKMAEADVIIAFIGENSYTETVGNIDDLILSSNQSDMVKELAKTGKPIILVLNEGRPRIIAGIEPLAAAVVHTFLPGNYGGTALANLLSGDAGFSARLPYTYPKHHGSFITYDCKPCEFVETMEGAYNYEANTVVQWPFCSGLSYSDVSYSDLKVVRTGDEIRFTVNVTNNSSRSVKEPVLLFVSDVVASLTPDVRRLRAFDKVSLAAGETKNVTLVIKPSDLAFVNEQMQWVVEPGEFRAMVADQSVTFSL